MTKAWKAKGARPATAKSAIPAAALSDASAIVPTTKIHAAKTMCTAATLMRDSAHDTIEAPRAPST